MKKQQQKTREPYGKVTEVGQVPIALQEISELAGKLLQAGMLSARLDMIKELADSIIAVTCANPGCLSQMAEGLPHRELQMVASGSLIPIEQAFTCHGCNAEITINRDDPNRRMFDWTDAKTGRKNPYCFNCDWILIQDGELPNAKKKKEVQ